MGFEQFIALIPQLLRQIDIICVRIFEPLNLVPNGIHRVIAIFADIFNIRHLVAQLTAVVNLCAQIFCYKSANCFSFPCVVGVKQLVFLRFVDSFVIESDHIGNCLAACNVKQAVGFLKSGESQLADIVRKLNLRRNAAVIVDYRRKLVNAAENGVACRSNQPLADAE